MARYRTSLIVSVLGLVLLLPGCRGAPPPDAEPVRPVRAMKVSDFEGMALRSFPGRASAAQEIDLAFRVGGPLVARPVKVGDVVTAGDLVARIDPRDFEVNVRNADGNVQRAAANRERAQSDLDRNLNIQRENPGAIAQATIDQSREALDVAKAEIAALEASLDAAKDALVDTELRAPFTGTVVATYVENFQNVRAKQMIVRLLDTTRVEFIVNIPETLISLAPHTREITVTFDAFPGVEVSATIKEIGAEASATTRTFPVTLAMDQPEGLTILPGMAGRAVGRPTTGPDAEPAIVIPVAAVFEPTDEGASSVWVIDEASSTVRRRTVELGKVVSAGYVIEAGLEPGEMIATAGVHFLQEGQEVRPQFQ
ncbi:MAG: efflux RND transporter periplasmic adaptor subunit [Planctomycetes bacterium]|nr:efflux RND transporter periplasmic adaptor subunit [Planctomycetota bacterium]